MNLKKKLYIDYLRDGVRNLLENDPKVFLIGEDIAEPYGGSFKVTKGLSDDFPGRLISTPMSEQGFIGMSIGMSIDGLKPIVEIMFGDFITLAVDQIVNHISKFCWLYNWNLNFVLRTPIGGYRGYGATHSQCLEKIFLGLPNIHIVSPSILYNPGDLLLKAINLGKPVIFIENKLDYNRQMVWDKDNYSDLLLIKTNDIFPIFQVSMRDFDSPEFSIISYGGLISELLDLQNELFFEDEIKIKIISVSELSIQNFESLFSLIKNDKGVLILEEGHYPFSWSDTIANQLIQLGYSAAIRTMGSKNKVIGTSKTLEDWVLPNKDTIKYELKLLGIYDDN